MYASDRYPVKDDAWYKVGVFTTNNTRELQQFNVSVTSGWSRYLRFEFLSDWGNEIYCPVSVLKVHGTTMIDQYKQTDTTESDNCDTEDCQEDVVENEKCPEQAADDYCLFESESLFSQKQCCVNIPKQSVLPQMKNSMYEALDKRLGTLERLSKEISGASQVHAGILEDLLGELNQTIATLDHDRATLQKQLDDTNNELLLQRKTVMLQTAIVVIVLIYLIAPRLDKTESRQYSRPLRLVPQAFNAGSDDEYTEPTFTFRSEAEDTYLDLGPESPTFTPSRPSTPIDLGN